MKHIISILLLSSVFFSYNSHAQTIAIGGPTTVNNALPANFLFKRYSLDLNTSLFHNHYGGDAAQYTSWLINHAHTFGSPYFNKAFDICQYHTPTYFYAITNGFQGNGLIYQSHAPADPSNIMTRFEYLVVCSN